MTLWFCLIESGHTYMLNMMSNVKLQSHLFEEEEFKEDIPKFLTYLKLWLGQSYG